MPDNNTILFAYAAVAAGSDEETTLRLIVDLARRIVGADEGSLLLLDHAARELVFAMTTGSTSSEDMLLGQRLPIGLGITGLAVHSKQVQIGAPTYKDIEQTEEIGEKGGPQAVIAAPLLARDEVVGAITAVSMRQGKRFTADDGEIFGRFGAIAGILIAQRQRLDAFERIASGQDPPRHLPAAQVRLIQSVANVARLRPEKVGAVADLMAAVEKIVGPQ